MGRAWRWWRYDYANAGHTPDAGPANGVRCRWRYDAEYFVPGTPVVADGTVHVATQAPAFSRSNLHGIDVETGTRRYATPTDDPFSELRGSPTVVDSVAYVAVLDDPPIVRGYSTASGKRTHEYDVGHLCREGVTPLLDGETVYAVTDWSLVAVDADTGDERWSFAPGESFHGAPALVDDTLYVGSAGEATDGPPIETGDDEWPHANRQYPRLRAIDATTGDVDWEVAVDVVPRTVAVHDGLAFCCGSEPYRRVTTMKSPVSLTDGGVPSYGMVHAVSVGGERRWTVDVDGRIRTAPAVADGTVLVAAEDGGSDGAGKLIALEASTGERRWTRAGEGRWTAASVADGVVYAGNAEGFVDALELADGSRLWRFATGTGVYGPPSISDGRVYVDDGAGTVYALEEAA